MNDLVIRVGRVAADLTCNNSFRLSDQQGFPRIRRIELNAQNGISIVEFYVVAGVCKIKAFLDDVYAGESLYIGDTTLQSDLDVWLANNSLPSETITGALNVNELLYINKTSTVSQILRLEMYCPLDMTTLNVNVGCPDPEIEVP